MSDMGTTPPSPGPSEDFGAEVPAESAERAAALGAPRELPQHGDFRTEIERAQYIAERVMERHYMNTFDRSRGDSTLAAETARQMGTLVLALLAVPGDVELHEAVFRMARRMVAEKAGLSEGEVGDMGILSR